MKYLVYEFCDLESGRAINAISIVDEKSMEILKRVLAQFDLLGFSPLMEKSGPKDVWGNRDYSGAEYLDLLIHMSDKKPTYIETSELFAKGVLESFTDGEDDED